MVDRKFAPLFNAHAEDITEMYFFVVSFCFGNDVAGFSYCTEVPAPDSPISSFSAVDFSPLFFHSGVGLGIRFPFRLENRSGNEKKRLSNTALFFSVYEARLANGHPGEVVRRIGWYGPFGTATIGPAPCGNGGARYGLFGTATVSPVPCGNGGNASVGAMFAEGPVSDFCELVSVSPRRSCVLALTSRMLLPH